MKYKKAVFLGLVLGVFFLNVLYAAEAKYKSINPKELKIDKESLKGKNVMFKDIFIGCTSYASDMGKNLPRFKNYFSFNTGNAGMCFLEKKHKDLIMDLKRGDMIIIYGKVDSWNPGPGPRYDFFVDKIEKDEDGR